MEPFIGQVCLFGFNFVPRGWAACDGQLMSIAQNQALFSLLGTTYGGDGRTTFGLPDLRGRAAVSDGTGPGLNPIRQGEKVGAQLVTLSASQLPSHTHTATLHAEAKPGSSNNPNGKMLALGGDSYAPVDPVEDKTLAPESIKIQATGNNAPVITQSPVLGMNYCIALQGIFPSRS